jgi:hypothetical protein
MLFLPRDFPVLENNSISTWDFKRQGFAGIGIVTERLFRLGLAGTGEEGIALGRYGPRLGRHEVTP